MQRRVLIVTGSVGEGHDSPAQAIAAQLRATAPPVTPIIVDALRVMPRLVTAASEGAPSFLYYRQQWAWDVEFFAFSRFGPGRLLGRTLLSRVAARSMEVLVRDIRPGVVVSVFPQATETLAFLRRRTRLTVPLCAIATDLAALYYKAAPGADLHCVAHPAGVAPVRRIAGKGAEVRVVHGLIAPEFLAARSRADARRDLALPAEGGIVLCSGGGWGVGDVEGAVAEALTLERVRLVVAVCGRNRELQHRMAASFGSSARVRVEGFTEELSDYMAAADALVHSSGGLTILEAQLRGCPAISYGWARGHVREQNTAFRRLGLATVARDRVELRGALARLLARPVRDDMYPTSLQRTLQAAPSVASLIMALAGAEPVGGQRVAAALPS